MTEKNIRKVGRKTLTVIIVILLIMSPIFIGFEFGGHEISPIEEVRAEHNGYVYVGGDGGELQKLSSDGQTVEWEYNGLSIVNSIKVVDGEVYVGGDTSVVKLNDADGTENWTYNGHSDTVRRVAVDADGNVYSGSYDNEVHKINGDTGSQIWTYSGHSDFVKGIAVSPDGNVITGSSDSEIHKLNSENGNRIWRYTGHSDGIQNVKVGQYGNLYSASVDTEVHRINTETGEQIWSYAHSSTVWSLAVTPDGHVSAGAHNGEIHKINSDTGNHIWTYTGHSSRVYALTADTDGNIYSGSLDGVAHKINGDTGSQIWTYSSISGAVLTTATKKSYTQSASGTVTDSAGNLISGATVEIRQSGSVVESTTTNSAGEYSFEVKDGDYTLFANKSQYHSNSISITVSGSDISEDITISSQDISGTIVDSDSNPIANANVEITDLSTGNVIYTHNTDSTGEYGTQVSDGDYQIDISHSEYESMSISVSVSDSDVNRNIVMGAKPEVSGKFVNSYGYSASGIEVTLLQDGNVVGSDVTDSNGNFTLFVANGTYTLNATNQTYIPFETTIEVDGNTNLGELTIREKNYNFNLRISPYMNHSTNQKYVAKFNGEIVNDNITITNSNKELITIDRNGHKLIATDNTSKTGEVNITAYYEVDGKNLSSSSNVTVAPIEIQHVEILSPLYKTLAIIGDRTIQYVILTVIAGVGVAMIINSFAGIGMTMIGLIIGWVIGFVPLGILLANVFGGIFIMMNTQLGMYERQR